METKTMEDAHAQEDTQMGMTEMPEVAEPIGSGAAAGGGAAPTLELVLRQGQSHDDPSQVRAKGAVHACACPWTLAMRK